LKYVLCIFSCLIAASNQGNRRNLLDEGNKGKKNNQAAHAAEEGKGLGLGGKGQAGKRETGIHTSFDGCSDIIAIRTSRPFT
jgi:hypothetical protein